MSDDTMNMAPCPPDSELMIAWESYQETDDFKNTLNWYGHKLQDPKGTLWAAFMAGWFAAGGRNPNER